MDKITQEIRDSPLAELVDTQELEANIAERMQRDEVQDALNSVLPSLPSRQTEIDAIFDAVKHPKQAWESVMSIIGSEVYEAAKDLLAVPEYNQKSSAKQEVFVFIGTHWKEARTQMYYDFVKEASRRIGLSEVYVQNQEYMNRLFENIGYRVSQYRETAQPADGVWINLRNCTISLTPLTPSPNGEGAASGTGSLVKVREHNPDDFFKYVLDYNYDPEAMCPLWHSFLDEVLPDKNAQRLLGEYVGYCFTKNLKLEKMAVFYGSGANGKSVILDVLTKLFGIFNVNFSSLSDVTTSPETRAKLFDKLVNISSESDEKLDMANLKKIISGEPTDTHILFKGYPTLYNPPKLITSYNELPPVKNSYALKRRWILFPFNVTIPESRQDPGMAGKLTQELPGILNWVLGCLGELMQRISNTPGESFTKSDDCNEALNTYFNSANSISMFLEECCKTNDSITNKVKDIYASYQAYCRATGITKPSILKNFKKALEDWGATLKQDSYTHVCICNVYVDASVYS